VKRTAIEGNAALAVLLRFLAFGYFRVFLEKMVIFIFHLDEPPFLLYSIICNIAGMEKLTIDSALKKLAKIFSTLY
jgi:hypothetical protein